MTDQADVNAELDAVEADRANDETEGREWGEAYSPPPWSVEVHEDFKGDGFDGFTSYMVVCDGYDDETPIVCVGHPKWGLSEADAKIIAAALGALEVCRRIRDGDPDSMTTLDLAGQALREAGLIGDDE